MYNKHAFLNALKKQTENVLKKTYSLSHIHALKTDRKQPPSSRIAWTVLSIVN